MFGVSKWKSVWKTRSLMRLKTEDLNRRIYTFAGDIWFTIRFYSKEMKANGKKLNWNWLNGLCERFENLSCNIYGTKNWYQFSNWIREKFKRMKQKKKTWTNSIYSFVSFYWNTVHFFYGTKRFMFFVHLSSSFAINRIICSKWNQLNEKRICLMSVNWIKRHFALRKKRRHQNVVCARMFFFLIGSKRERERDQEICANFYWKHRECSRIEILYYKIHDFAQKIVAFAFNSLFSCWFHTTNWRINRRSERG